MKALRVVAAAMAVAAAGWAQAGDPHHTYKHEPGALYTMTNAAAGNEVVSYARSADGTLTPASTYPTGGLGLGAGLGNQGGVVLSDNERWLFVVNAGSNEISVFAVRKDKNELKHVQTINSQGVQPVSVTSSDDLVYVLNAGSDSIAGFRMSPKGKLEYLDDSYRGLSGAGTGAAEVQFGPGGRDLVISEKATNKLVVYELQRDGRPENTPTIVDSAGQTPFGFSFGKHRNVFVSEAATRTVSAYHLTRDGGLELVDGPVPTGHFAPCWIVVTPNGRYVYTTNAGSSVISGFRVDAEGKLTPLNADGRTASTGAGTAPIDMAISHNGRFLYALSANIGTLSQFRVNGDGSLDPIGTSTVPIGANGLAAR